MESMRRISEQYYALPLPIKRLFWIEMMTRGILLTLIILLEILNIAPFMRIIQPEEAWKYNYPMSHSILPYSLDLWLVVLVTCGIIAALDCQIHNDFRAGVNVLLVPSLAIPLVALITNILKITIGRPRPDFLNRCYGRGYRYAAKDYRRRCIGEPRIVMSGRKSFPSGHSSLSFCALGFMALYVAGQLRTFSTRGGLAGWKIILPGLPLLVATLIAVSRTCKYRHHSEDVIAGGALGLFIVYIVYRQYYRSLSDPQCHIPYTFGNAQPNQIVEETRNED